MEKNKVDKDLHKEYQKYMKIVTDGFVNMQSDNFEGVMGHERISCFDTVEWKGGLKWNRLVSGSFFMSGITREDAKGFNADVALKYLKENTLTFKEWKSKMGM